MKKRTAMLYLAFMLALNLAPVLVPAAMAIEQPAEGDFAYDVYDIAVNKILKGPVGFVCGAACIVLGAVAAVKNQLMLAVPAFIGAGILLKADSLITTLGVTF